MVTEFVGFMGAYQQPGTLSPAVAGALGALVVTWATFRRSLSIFLGAPYVEVLRGNRRLASALSGVTAAVVGVVLNLALVLGIHTLLRSGAGGRGARQRGPRAGVVLGGRVRAVGDLAASFIAMWRFKVHVSWVVGAAAALGTLAP